MAAKKNGPSPLQVGGAGARAGRVRVGTRARRVCGMLWSASATPVRARAVDDRRAVAASGTILRFRVQMPKRSGGGDRYRRSTGGGAVGKMVSSSWVEQPRQKNASVGGTRGLEIGAGVLSSNSSAAPRAARPAASTRAAGAGSAPTSEAPAINRCDMARDGNAVAYAPSAAIRCDGKVYPVSSRCDRCVATREAPILRLARATLCGRLWPKRRGRSVGRLGDQVAAGSRSGDRQSKRQLMAEASVGRRLPRSGISLLRC